MKKMRSAFLEKIQARNNKESFFRSFVFNYKTLLQDKIKKSSQTEISTLGTSDLSILKRLTEDQLILHREKDLLEERVAKLSFEKEEYTYENHNLLSIQSNLVYQINEYKQKLKEKQLESQALLVEIERRNEVISQNDILLQSYRKKLSSSIQNSAEYLNKSLFLEKEIVAIRKKSPGPQKSKKKSETLDVRTRKKAKSTGKIPKKNIFSNFHLKQKKRKSKKIMPFIERKVGKKVVSIPCGVFRNIGAHPKSINSVEVVGKRNIVVSGSSDELVKFWDLEGNFLGELNDLKIGRVQDVACDEELRTLSCCGDNNSNILLYDLKVEDVFTTVGHQRRVMKGHSDNVYVIKYVNNEKIISGSRDKTVKIWSSKNANVTMTYMCDSSICDIVILNENIFLVACYEGNIQLYDSRKQKKVYEFSSKHKKPPSYLHYLPKTHYLMSTSFDNTIHLYDIRRFDVVKKFVDGDYVCGSNIQSSSCETIVATGSHFGDIFLWDKNSNDEKKAKFVLKNVHDKKITCVNYDSSAGYFVTASQSGEMNFLSLRNYLTM